MTKQELQAQFRSSYLELLKMGKIYFYAKSLTIPKEELETWKKDKLFPEITLPHAHEYQRRFTYPFEYPDFEQYKKAIYHILYAGNQGGKSVMINNWMLMECLGIHPLQAIGLRPMPPLHWWCISPNLPTTADVPRGEDTPLLRTLYEWVSDSIDGGPGVKKFYRLDKLMTIIDKDGNESVINFKGYDQLKDKFKGEAVDGVLFDERPPLDIWRECVPRILAKKGIFLLAMTPDYSSIWTADLLRKRNDSEHHILEMDALENPFMPAEYREKVLSTMTEDELYMRRFGKHIQIKGKVFPFDYQVHVGKPFIPSNDTCNYVIIDWHPAKPIIITYLAINANNIWYVFNESVIYDHTIEVVAKDYNNKITLPEYKLEIRKTLIDKIASVPQIRGGGVRPKDVVSMLREFGINCKIGDDAFEGAHTFLTKKLKYKEIFFDPSCNLHTDQFNTWGSKRYLKGDLEGTLRDQLELEGNDTCMNLVYAYNARAQFTEKFTEDEPGKVYGWKPRPAVERIYGRRI